MESWGPLFGSCTSNLAQGTFPGAGSLQVYLTFPGAGYIPWCRELTGLPDNPWCRELTVLPDIPWCRELTVLPNNPCRSLGDILSERSLVGCMSFTGSTTAESSDASEKYGTLRQGEYIC